MVMLPGRRRFTAARRVAEIAVGDDAAVRSHRNWQRWQRSVSRSAGDDRVATWIEPAAVARTGNLLVRCQLGEHRAPQMGADGAERDDTSRRTSSPILTN